MLACCRLLYDTKGRFVPHRISKEEATYKLCKVKRCQFGKGGVPFIATHDGRTIRYPDPDIKVGVLAMSCLMLPTGRRLVWGLPLLLPLSHSCQSMCCVAVARQEVVTFLPKHVLCCRCKAGHHLPLYFHGTELLLPSCIVLCSGAATEGVSCYNPV